MEEVLSKTIQDILSSQCAFCRYITANDTGTTGAHQAGFYIPKNAARLLFEEPVQRGQNKDKYVNIKWQNDFVTKSRFIYYGKGTRNEFRITRFGHNFPFLNDDHVGSLLILAEIDEENYVGYILSNDEDIDSFLSFFNLSPDKTNQLIDIAEREKPEEKLNGLLNNIVSQLYDFPETTQTANFARICYDEAFHINLSRIKSEPDQMLLNWIDTEYILFQKIENKICKNIIGTPFHDVKSFIVAANQILNRRKSRAGKSLEHHLAAIFDASNILYEEQVNTEDRKKPDFIFPNGICYHNFEFPADLLISLAAKTTCKDRWRQVINEANRISEKHLFTLQQAISKNQLKEMRNENVTLVIPHKYIKNYPAEYQSEILDLNRFIQLVKEKQNKTPKIFLVR